jgi:hypothetical protein
MKISPSKSKVVMPRYAENELVVRDELGEEIITLE